MSINLIVIIALCLPNPNCTRGGPDIYENWEWWKQEANKCEKAYDDAVEAKLDAQLYVCNEMATHGCSDPAYCEILEFLIFILTDAQEAVEEAIEDVEFATEQRDITGDTYINHINIICIDNCSL